MTVESIFTFHSCTILIYSSLLFIAFCRNLYIPLLYDSNLILLTKFDRNLFFYIPLWYDSNGSSHQYGKLFLRLYIPLWYDSNKEHGCETVQNYSFTFHSGTILISTTYNTVKQFTHFTFHSGTILIQHPPKNYLAIVLYIPLWYDSNNCWIRVCSRAIELYIPLWYDSNCCAAVFALFATCSLHSTLVRF